MRAYVTWDERANHHRNGPFLNWRSVSLAALRVQEVYIFFYAPEDYVDIRQLVLPLFTCGDSRQVK